jgi:hypothetical protein
VTPLATWTIGVLAIAVAGCNGSGNGNDAGDDVEAASETGDVPADADAETGTDAAGDAEADVPPVVPPRICRTPEPLGRGPYFQQATDQVGLGTDQLHPLGNRIAAVDLDGDGYVDLIVHRVYENRREDPEAGDPSERLKRVFMNRPAAGGRRRFVEATIESRYGALADGSGLGRSAQFAVAGDVDNDGDLDLFSGTYVNSASSAAPDPGDRSVILLNDGTGVFEIAPASAVSPGPAERWTTTSASFLDYDRDGNLDLFVGFWYRQYGYLEGLQDRLYRGNGDGTFEDVTAAAGLATTASGYAEGTNHRPTYGVTVCDVDSDGDADLLVSAYGRSWNMLWENRGDGTFADIAPEVGFHGDSLADYGDNQFYRCYCQANPGVCDPAPPLPSIGCGDYWSPGLDDQPFRANGNTFSTACGDIDNDGDMDLMSAEIRHWHIGSSSDPSELLRNVPAPSTRGWTFERPGNAAIGLARTWTAPDWNEGDIFIAFIDFDNDGRKDVFLGSTDYPGTRGFLFHQQTDGTFREIGRTAGVNHPGASGMAWADFDRDGDLDLVVGSATARSCCGWTENQVHYYRNDVGQDGNWLQVVLEGSGTHGTNRSAIGARVAVTAGGVTQVQEVGGGYGHFGIQNDLVLHFGLGDACDVDSIEVRWPDGAGTAETWADVRANYRVRLVRGDSRAYYLTD